MTKRCSCFVLLTLAAMISAGGLSTVAAQSDPGRPDTIRIGCPIFFNSPTANDSVAIPLYLWNDEDIGYFIICIRHDSKYGEFGRASFRGSVVPPGTATYRISTTNERRYEIGTTEEMQFPLPPRTGDTAELFVTLFLKLASGVHREVVNLDSSSSMFCVILVPHRSVNSFRPQFTDCGSRELYIGFDSMPAGCGDVDGSGRLNIVDAVFLLRFLYSAGDWPRDMSVGDLDASRAVDSADVIYLMNYLIKRGPPPCPIK